MNSSWLEDQLNKNTNPFASTHHCKHSLTQTSAMFGVTFTSSALSRVTPSAQATLYQSIRVIKSNAQRLCDHITYLRSSMMNWQMM